MPTTYDFSGLTQGRCTAIITQNAANVKTFFK